MPAESPPLWLLAELTYACPLQCPYCSNPVGFAGTGGELATGEWIRVLQEARELGAAQLGLSGGEPATRSDLEDIVAEARRLGYYTNLITSGLGLDEQRVHKLAACGLDHIQVSFQAASASLNDRIAATRAFEHKLVIAEAVKRAGLPMVLCFVLHRENLHQVGDMLTLAEELQADYVELATTQYYGWALLNRDRLLPSQAQLTEAERTVEEFRRRHRGRMTIYYVVPDYYEGRPKACMNGWASTAINITPDGLALPCHGARSLPIEFPSVREHPLRWIWHSSPGFNRFRGSGWMPEPCRSCPERDRDLGGCRCQAYVLTGDAAATDPACDKAPGHGIVRRAIADADAGVERPLVFRNPKTSRSQSQPR